MADVMGVDASSTRLAAVFLHGSEITTNTLHLPSDIAEACAIASQWMAEAIEDRQPRLVAVEAPFMHRAHPSGSVPMAQVNGAVLAGAARSRVVSVTPSRWKKQVLGNGSAKKEVIEQWVKANYPLAHQSFLESGKLCQDLCDALCIALHGLHVLELRDRMLVRK